jgi:hypothetical protein
LFGRTTLSGRGVERNLRSVTRQTSPATATLEIDPHAEAPTGVLSSELGRLEFSGWAELAAAIEQWRARIRGHQLRENTSRREGTPDDASPRQGN